MLNRRRFLEESMIAAAAAIGTGAMASAIEQKSQPDSTAPSDRIRHAVLGCRIRGKVHAAEFSKLPGVEVVYVVDPDLQLANTVADSVEKQTGKRPQVTHDLRRVNDDASVDTISIAAPNHWHALAAIWGMQSGKHVYVEKPVSHNVWEGRRMVEVAQQTKKICQVGTQNRSRGDLQAVADFIRAGKLGKIELARTIVYGSRGSIGARGAYQVPVGVDYDLWLGPAQKRELTRPQLHYDWHWDWNTGNGELGNNNIHYVDICRWLLNLNGLGKSVISLGGRFGYEDAGDTPNTQIVVHEFDHLTLIQEVRGLKTDPFRGQFKGGCVIHGSEGFIVDASWFDLQGNLVKKFEGKAINHFANFIDAVRSNDRQILKADIVQGHQSTALCHIGNISYRVGQDVGASEIPKRVSSLKMNDSVQATVDSMLEHLASNGLSQLDTKIRWGEHLKVDGESFVGNANADALLRREYRAPFVVPTA